MEIPIFHFSAFFHGGHIENGYFDNIACDLLLASCFIRKNINIYRKKLISESPVGGVHRVLLHPRLTCIICDPFDLSDPKIDLISNSYDLYTGLDGLENPQVWFAAKLNILQQFHFFYLTDPDPWLWPPI